MSGFVPLAILALVLGIAWTARDPSRGTGWIILGIVLIPVSAVVTIALQGESETIPVTGLPWVLLSMTLMAYGLAVVLVDTLLVGEAKQAGREPPDVTDLRIVRLNLAVHVLAPCFALYFHLLRLGGLDEAAFNALFRFFLFLIVYTPLTVILTLPQATSRSRALLALGIPLLFAAAKAFTGGLDELYVFLLYVAVINVLAVWIVLAGLALAAILRVRQREAWGFLALAVGATALSILLSWGTLRRLGEELVRIEELGRLEGVLWIVLPAVLIATDMLWKRAPVLRRGRTRVLS